MNNEIVCTGVGIVSASGADAGQHWAQLAGGGLAPTTSVALFGDEFAPVTVAAVADGFDHGMASRQCKRVDRFTLLAAAAAREAVRHAGLEPAPGHSDRFGVFVANATGGWSYVEPQLYGLYGQGDAYSVNPYVATAWFPTAVQGEVSIAMGLGGLSKTFSAENLSFAFALRHAMWALESGELAAAMVIGVEAPLTPLVYNACRRLAAISPDGSHRPYRHGSTGGFLGEAAAALVLERRTEVTARQGHALAAVEMPVIGSNREDVLVQALAGRGEQVGWVAMEGRGDVEADQQELFALEGAFEGNLPTLGVPAGTVGTLLGASLAVQTATALLGVVRGQAPGGMRVRTDPGRGVQVQTGCPSTPEGRPLAMAIGTGRYDQCGAIVVRALDVDPS